MTPKNTPFIPYLEIPEMEIPDFWIPEISIPLNWLSLMLIIFILPSPFWTVSFSTLVHKSAVNLMTSETQSLMKFSLGAELISSVLFSVIMVMNVLGLIPYVFTPTSHLSVTLALSLMAWLGFTTASWTKSPAHHWNHLIPAGTPSALGPFMILIELVSNFIRPLTLSIRLMANMTAGHLLLTLLNLNFTSLNPLYVSFLFFPLSLLIILESAVALIQSYVFSILTVMYMNEVSDIPNNHSTFEEI